MGDGPREGCNCKIGDAIEEYSLDDLDADLVHHRENDDYSLRDLRDEVNKRILESAFEQSADEAGSLGTLEGIMDSDELVDEVYETLQSPNEDPKRTARIKTKLEQSGLDISSIKTDFVTHPTVKKHLNSCLDVDTSHSTSIDESDAINTIEWARTRCQNIVERTITRLVTADIIHIRSPEAGVSVSVHCQECQGSYTPRELLREGGCSCPSDGD
jgi:hypothetical protein